MALRYINNILSIMLGYFFGKNSWYVFTSFYCQAEVNTFV